MTTDSADYCMLVNEWTWSKSQVCLLRLEVDMSSVLESELGNMVHERNVYAKSSLMRKKKLGFSYIIADVSVYDSIVRKLYKYSRIFTDSST